MGVFVSVPMAMMAAPMAAMSAFCCCCQGIMCICSTANCLSCCCRGALGRRTGISPRLAKIFYILILGFAAILAIILRFNSTQVDLGALSVSCSGGNTTVTIEGFSQGTYVYCKGDAAVFRVSFILSCFFGFMLVASLFSERLHRGFWFLKITLIVGGIIGAFFMPNSAFDNQGYAWSARIGSAFFLVLQILVLIDFAYQWNEIWVGRAYQDPMNADVVTNNKWLIGLLVSAGGLYVASITGIGLLYAYYGDCAEGKAYTTVTVLAFVVITILSLFRDRIVGQPGAILPAAVVIAYSVFLCWGSLESNPNASCRPSNQQTGASIAIGAAWATITLLWTTFSVTSNAGHLVKGEELEKAEEVQAKEAAGTGDVEAQQPKPVKTKQTGPASGGPVFREELNEPAGAPPRAVGDAGDDDEDDSPVYSSERPWTFHFIMLCASMYLAMLLTDWGTFTGGSASFTSGQASMWVKISAQWLTIILFIWTLIAPAVLQGREF